MQIRDVGLLCVLVHKRKYLIILDFLNICKNDFLRQHFGKSVSLIVHHTIRERDNNQKLNYSYIFVLFLIRRGKISYLKCVTSYRNHIDDHIFSIHSVLPLLKFYFPKRRKTGFTMLKGSIYDEQSVCTHHVVL